MLHALENPAHHMLTNRSWMGDPAQTPMGVLLTDCYTAGYNRWLVNHICCQLYSNSIVLIYRVAAIVV